MILILIIALVSANHNATQCFRSLAKVLRGGLDSFENDPGRYGRMYTYSGKSLNDIGRYDDCESIAYARYALLQIQKNPFKGYSICGPDICTEDDYIQIINDAIMTLNELNPTMDSLFRFSKNETKYKNTTINVVFPHTILEEEFKING